MTGSVKMSLTVFKILNFGESYLLGFLNYHFGITTNNIGRAEVYGPNFKIVLYSQVS